MEVTIGGNRVGSGKKMQAHLHNYNRSTHNLSETFASSMTCGVLYPALCKLAMRGDSFDISINADCRTIPTVGPLFGSFKMQVDVYQCPVRLYQGILHNNPLAIGLKMQQVKFPLLNVQSVNNINDASAMKMNTSSLMHYMGMSGLGMSGNQAQKIKCGRKINALPFLSYYDIFKTYYANKQEDQAYVISAIEKGITCGILDDSKYKIYNMGTPSIKNVDTAYEIVEGANSIIVEIPMKYIYYYQKWGHGEELIFRYTVNEEDFDLTLNDLSGTAITTNIHIKNVYTELNIDGKNEGNDRLLIEFNKNIENFESVEVMANEVEEEIYNKLSLVPFDLSNIDDMRYDLLSHHTLGSAFEIEQGTNDYLPYSVLIGVDNKDKSLNTYPLNGLVLKTYQNDIFNNWLNTEWIEGENSITELTKVAIVDGAFSMDSLNFAQKQYNMLNRIATAGATYEDWQDVVYEEVKRRQIESPMFVGGMSQEVVFDEIVQNAPANINGEVSQLGDLGGRGKLLNNKKGGKIHIKCDEACFIIAIVSLTPRVYYTQGNEFYLTDVLSLDDMHKPPMDGIGFQDLIGERMAYFDTVITPTNGSTAVMHRSKIGKLPAWIEYMTSYDRAHGDFAEDAAGYMILSRRYEQDETTGGIKDATTYIDPTKYNYAFAYRNLDSQNFWVQVAFNIKARRLMSARLIPNV